MLPKNTPNDSIDNTGVDGLSNNLLMASNFPQPIIEPPFYNMQVNQMNDQERNTLAHPLGLPMG